MMALLSIWLVVGIVLMMIGTGEGRYSAGMPLAYFLGLSLIHTPGAAVYLDMPQWDALAHQTNLGFEQTVIGMVAFLIGVIVARYNAVTSLSMQTSKVRTPSYFLGLERLALLYLIGGICFFVVGPAVPFIGAVVGQSSSWVVVGASLRIWVARQQRSRLKFWLVVSLLPLLPVITLLRGGFIIFGIYWLLTVLSFTLAQSRQRLGYFLIAPFFIFVGLSVFVNYMATRSEFRQKFWVQQIGLGDRIEHFVVMFKNFEWYSSDNPKHRNVIDGRLNQNLLVGSAVDRLESGSVHYANGATLVEMAISLVPRAVWPDKPAVGGGGTVAQEFSGFNVAAGTSVGAGQVLEFYINFGTWGVIGGFLVYGWLIGRMDLLIMERLNQNDQKGFLLWFMVCIALLQPGSNLLEIVTTVVASAVNAWALSYVLKGRFGDDKVSSSARSRLGAT
jgi:hypothetical protein